MAFYANAPLPDTNARQVAQTIRMPSTALLTIDSEDRYADYNEARTKTTSPYDFSIRKNESLMPGFITRVGISEVVFPWVIPNINSITNRIFIQTSHNSGANLNSTSITIVEGFYTPDALASELTATINTWLTSLGFGDSISIVYGAGDVPNFSFDVTSGGTLDVFGFEPEIPGSAVWPYPATSKQLFDMLGLGGATLTNNAVLLTPGILYEGSSTLCQAIRYVDIVCNQLTNSQAQKDQTSQTVARDMLCRIYLGDAGGSAQSTIPPSSTAFCPPGCAPCVLYRNYTNPKQIQWIPNQNIPGFLQFQVYDDTGLTLNDSVVIMGNELGVPGYSSTDWSMTMLVSEN
jgi:hypothetical protein